MTIFFVASCSPAISPLARALTASVPLRAANDNRSNHPPQDLVLRDALRHFSRHGLGAAEEARQRAERAFFAGDMDKYRRWLDICRALDRRMASALATRNASAPLT